MASLERSHNDNVIVDLEEDGSSDEEYKYDPGNEEYAEEIFDPVCSLGDNGGTLMCCEGSCIRSFHATQEYAEEVDSGCVSLGFTENELQVMRQFKCRNCQFNLHQCFSCGQLGSSDLQAGAQVFQCGNATCGYFYHPDCVAERLHLHSEDAATELKQKIRAGEPFTCPFHLCFVCRQPEDKTDHNLQMAVCKRCPKAYHRRWEISFDGNEVEGNFPRAWEGLYADRILMYCLEHEIDEFLGTPLRNHIKFPGDELERAIVADISSGAGAPE